MLGRLLNVLYSKSSMIYDDLKVKSSRCNDEEFNVDPSKLSKATPKRTSKIGPIAKDPMTIVMEYVPSHDLLKNVSRCNKEFHELKVFEWERRCKSITDLMNVIIIKTPLILTSQERIIDTMSIESSYIIFSEKMVKKQKETQKTNEIGIEVIQEEKIEVIQEKKKDDWNVTFHDTKEGADIMVSPERKEIKDNPVIEHGKHIVNVVIGGFIYPTYKYEFQCYRFVALNKDLLVVVDEKDPTKKVLSEQGYIWNYGYHLLNESCKKK